MRKEVPWEYSEHMIKMWRWLTPHFDAQVKSDAEGIRFIYSVTDLTRGKRVPLVNDFAQSFPSAEQKILEFIGKSYPPAAGYRPYAGNLATTFLIGTGESIDFGPHEGSRVIITVKTPEGKQTITGSLQVKNHDVEILTENRSTVVIPPVLITSVRHEYSNDSGKPTEAKRQSNNRIVPGKHQTGCTGKPGFFDNTVEHSPTAPWCPVHRV